jgi:hypothetical protein
MSTQSPTSPDLHLLDSCDDFLLFALKLFTQTRRHIAILSQDLDPALFNTDAFVDAISQLARSHRNAHIQILIKDPQPLIDNTHKLALLAQRLPSKISIRKLMVEPSDKKMGFILYDDRGLVYKNDDSTYQGFANFNAQAEVKHFREIFDYVWQYGETEPELQQLHL